MPGKQITQLAIEIYFASTSR